MYVCVCGVCVCVCVCVRVCLAKETGLRDWPSSTEAGPKLQRLVLCKVPPGPLSPAVTPSAAKRMMQL